MVSQKKWAAPQIEPKLSRSSTSLRLISDWAEAVLLWNILHHTVLRDVDLLASCRIDRHCVIGQSVTLLRPRNSLAPSAFILEIWGEDSMCIIIINDPSAVAQSRLFHKTVGLWSQSMNRKKRLLTWDQSVSCCSIYSSCFDSWRGNGGRCGR